MKHVRIDTDWVYRGMQAITMENSHLRFTILPEMGAKIIRLVHKASDTALLWENPRLTMRPVSYGSCYDDHFFGGWDELFPNDAPATINGEPVPDHGELWCQPWQSEITERSDARVTVHLWCYGAVVNARVDKWLTLDAGSPVIRFRHRITNAGSEPLDFLWKLHPALAISPTHRLDLPPCTAIRADADWSDIVCEERFTWPFCMGKDGSRMDMRTVLGLDRDFKDFLYGVDIDDGWCAMTDTATGVGFGMRFPKEVFSSVWLFVSSGGWRGHRTAVLEPCTAYPFDLDTAVAQGTCSHLEPTEILECETEAVVYSGLTAVDGIGRGGIVTGT